MASRYRGHEESKERDPVLLIGDGQCADRFEEVIVEREHRGYRREDRLRQSPTRGDAENHEQHHKRDGCRVGVDHSETYGSHRDDRSQTQA